MGAKEKGYVMAKMMFKSGLLFLAINVLGSVSYLAAENSWAVVSQRYDDHKELMKLVGCLAHIPGILTIDSKNQLAIKAAAFLALTATDIKILIDLFKKNEDCLAKNCVYDIPKTTLYALASYYDYVRLTGKPKDLDTKLLEIKPGTSAKITQFVQLGVEVLLRTLACIDRYNRGDSANKYTGRFLSELADWVELCRLMDRFALLSDQDATFDKRFDDIKQSVAKRLNEVSGLLVKQ